MPDRPNIVLCISDQQRADTMPGDRQVPVSTPHLDWLAERGTLFRRAFCTSPMCSPARSTILTGLYPHATGLVANHQEREISREISLLSEMILNSSKTSLKIDTVFEDKSFRHCLAGRFPF